MLEKTAISPETKAHFKSGLKYTAATGIGTGLGIGAGTLAYGLLDRSGLGQQFRQLPPETVRRIAQGAGGTLGALGGMATMHHNLNLRKRLEQQELENAREEERKGQVKAGSAIRLLEKRAMELMV